LTTTARRVLLSLATLFLCASLPAAANVAARPDDACRMQHNDPIVLHRALPNGSLGTQRKAVESVTVSRDGLVRQVVLAHSSGDAGFDAAALRATERTAFAPAARSCVAVDSTFGYAIVANAGGGVATSVLPGSITVVASRH
jgi:TonB family protein